MQNVKTNQEMLIERYTTSVNACYGKLEDYIDDKMLWPEMQYVRDEIIDCLLIGANQAAITLTNHFLEKSLKMGLIYHSSGGKKVHFGDQMQTYEKALNDIDDSDLSQTINACCGKGLIDKPRKKKLQDYRDRFRNSYSHANSQQTFGGLTAPAAIFPTENSTHYKIEVNPIASLPYIHGMAQKILAEMEARPYFTYVYETHKIIEQRVEGVAK